MAKSIKVDILFSYFQLFFMPSKDTTNKIVAAVTFIVIVGGVASYSMVGQQVAVPTVTPTVLSTTTSMPISTSSITATTPTPTSGSTVATYKDGTYSADGSYVSPGGAELIGVNVTVAKGIITDVQVTPKATLPISQKFQKLFADNYKQYVVGKNINEVNVTKIAGSSLTPKGFVDALAKIKAQAQS